MFLFVIGGLQYFFIEIAGIPNKPVNAASGISNSQSSSYIANKSCTYFSLLLLLLSLLLCH